METRQPKLYVGSWHRVQFAKSRVLGIFAGFSGSETGSVPSATTFPVKGRFRMSVILLNGMQYRHVAYESESDLERTVVQLQQQLFGPDRFYLDIKRRIGTGGATRNVPDGYVIDLSGAKPRLFVVENELAAHDPLRHIAVQILQFSLSFESDSVSVKRVLMDALNENQKAKHACERYVNTTGYRGIDHLLEYLAFDSPFSALVIIDEIPGNLENVLSEKFRFGVEVLELVRFENDKGEKAYQFDPFLADVTGDVLSTVPREAHQPDVDTSDLDTVVVPAREDGFQETFLDENRWYAVRIHGMMRPQIRYVAAYQVAPVSAITYVAPVKEILPWKDTDKVVLNFVEPAQAIGPICLVKGGKVKALQNLRYTSYSRLKNAKTLDDLWGESTAGAGSAA